ncbi:MAG: glycosyltransferase, partial [Bdellovibrionales bacterium]|nr:glycosyltransferase [Bdellovibrionales bacterium]
LRLDVAGAEFVNVPVPLYAWRAHAASTAQTVNQKDYATPAGVRALTDYVAAKGLPWKIEAGMRPTTYRAIPQIQGEPEVLAVVPFKEQKELTLQAVRHALDQKGVRVRVVAVDNGSQDLSIAQELTAMGAEVLRIDEPFNFSRLNNLAIARTRYREIQNILFLNNDVILNAGAVLEMVRWVDQPKIGLVGARLNYPNGNLQHGGVILDGMLAHERMPWRHEDKNAPEMALAFAAVIHTADAVTAACAMMKRALFNQVGGFDEIWYPIAFSDTDLAAKLKALGYVSLYTPFAVGIHHESVSRAVGNIEDYEGSRWLYNRLRGPKQA